MELDRVLPTGNDPNALCYCEACLRAKIAAVYVANSLRELESDSRSESPTQHR